MKDNQQTNDERADDDPGRVRERQAAQVLGRLVELRKQLPETDAMIDLSLGRQLSIVAGLNDMRQARAERDLAVSEAIHGKESDRVELRRRRVESTRRAARLARRNAATVVDAGKRTERPGSEEPVKGEEPPSKDQNTKVQPGKVPRAKGKPGKGQPGRERPDENEAR